MAKPHSGLSQERGLSGHREIGLCLLLALQGAACHASHTVKKPPQAEHSLKSIEQRVTRQLLSKIALIATGKSADEKFVSQWHSSIKAQRASLSGFVDEVLKSEGFAQEVAPTMILGPWISDEFNGAPLGAALQQTETNPPIYFLEKPCTLKQAVKVRPWWDLKSEVHVCPSSYAPEVKHADNPQHHCSGLYQAGRAPCGCGYNLMRCARDGEHYQAIVHSLNQELKRTLAYVVNAKQPLERVFLANETYRDRNAEFLYQRQRVEHGDADPESTFRKLESWPADGQWAAREISVPGQHSGILTTYSLMGMFDHSRGRINLWLKRIWCAAKSATASVEPETVLKLHVGAGLGNGESWQRLTVMPVCTGCHARLDYGAQFFKGYPFNQQHVYFSPEDQLNTPGPFYGDDIRDLRAHGPRTPQGWAEIAVEQPEFKSCMVKHVEDYVMGNHGTAADARAIGKAFQSRRRIDDAVKAALLRYATNYIDSHPTEGTKPQAVAKEDPLALKPTQISTELATVYQEHCLHCHSGQKAAAGFSLDKSRFATVESVKILSQVAYGTMPREAPTWTAKDQRRVVELLIHQLWSSPEDRVEARRYFINWMSRSLPVMPLGLVNGLVKGKTGVASVSNINLLEGSLDGDLLQYSPGISSAVAVKAFTACKEKVDKTKVVGKERDAKLQSCMAEILQFNNLSPVLQ